MNTDHLTDEQIDAAVRIFANYRVVTPAIRDDFRAAFATLPEPAPAILPVIDVTDEDCDVAWRAWSDAKAKGFPHVGAALNAYADRLRERVACWVPLPDGVTEIPAGVRVRRESDNRAVPSATVPSATEWTTYATSGQTPYGQYRWFVHSDDLPKLTPPDPRIAVLQEWLREGSGDSPEDDARDLLARLDALSDGSAR